MVSAVKGCVSISEFVSLVGVSIGIVILAVGLKTCALTAGIKIMCNHQEKMEEAQ